MQSQRTRCAAALAVLLAASGARAASFEIAPGAEGEDTSPYAFFAVLNRGQYGTVYASSAEEDGASHAFESYLRFPLPEDAACGEVVSATLELYYAIDSSGFGSGSTEPGELHCHEVLESWSEGSLTWSHRPDIAPAFDVVTNVAALGPISCDVTELAGAWLSGEAENYGIALTNPTSRLIGFYSFEAADAAAVGKKAKLVIETTGVEGADADEDCAPDAEDNCPATPNAAQADVEGDGVGDACDVCPSIFDPAQLDGDVDGRGDACSAGAADLDDDALVTKLDKKVFKAATKKNAPYRADLDLDGNGRLDKLDWNLWKPLYEEFLVKKPPK